MIQERILTPVSSSRKTWSLSTPVGLPTHNIRLRWSSVPGPPPRVSAGEQIRYRHDQFSWPFHLVRAGDKRPRGRDDLLQRGRRLGHAGRVATRHAVYPL